MGADHACGKRQFLNKIQESKHEKQQINHFNTLLNSILNDFYSTTDKSEIAISVKLIDKIMSYLA